MAGRRNPARYLQSDFQTHVQATIDGLDWSAPDVFTTPLFVIDASGDAAGFGAAVDDSALALLIEAQDTGVRPSGAWPRRPVAAYILAQRVAHARMLDRSTRAEVERVIRRWLSEAGRNPSQASKSEMTSPPSAVEILLPVRGMRFPVPLWGL